MQLTFPDKNVPVFLTYPLPLHLLCSYSLLINPHNNVNLNTVCLAPRFNKACILRRNGPALWQAQCSRLWPYQH